MRSKVEYGTTDNWKHVPLVKASSLSLPKYVGNWELGKGTGVHFSMLKKPNWFNRVMTKLLLGWIWKNN